MVKRNLNGQSLIEVIFSVGVIILVISAVLTLLVTSLKSRSQSFNRNKAAELGQKVMEELVTEKETGGREFWDLDSEFWQTNLGTTQTMTGFPGYNYAIGFTQVFGPGAKCPGSGAVFECANATIGVGWSGDVTQKVIFTRFFSKK